MHRLEAIEQQRQDALDYVKKQTQYAIYLNSSTDPTNYEKQLGKSYTSLEFETKLRNLNQNLLFEVHPFKLDKKCVYVDDLRGKHFICAYENGHLPEHSVMARKSEEVWDTDFVKTKVVGGIPVSHINKADIPKSEFIPGKGLVFEGGGNPGFKEVETVWHEAIRGWRTVLIRLVEAGLITPTQAESTFGSDNTPSWARATGKSKPTNLW